MRSASLKCFGRPDKTKGEDEKKQSTYGTEKDGLQRLDQNGRVSKSLGFFSGLMMVNVGL